jgi:hypothetical protein
MILLAGKRRHLYCAWMFIAVCGLAGAGLLQTVHLSCGHGDEFDPAHHDCFLCRLFAGHPALCQFSREISIPLVITFLSEAVILVAPCFCGSRLHLRGPPTRVHFI